MRRMGRGCYHWAKAYRCHAASAVGSTLKTNKRKNKTTASHRPGHFGVAARGRVWEGKTNHCRNELTDTTTPAPVQRQERALEKREWNLFLPSKEQKNKKNSCTSRVGYQLLYALSIPVIENHTRTRTHTHAYTHIRTPLFHLADAQTQMKEPHLFEASEIGGEPFESICHHLVCLVGDRDLSESKNKNKTDTK